MSNSSNEKLSFEEFSKVLAEVLLVPEERITREASFTTDLTVDSIRWVEMALSIEQMGVQVPTEAFWDINTWGMPTPFMRKTMRRMHDRPWQWSRGLRTTGPWAAHLAIKGLGITRDGIR
jgi:acyl carrier protein